MKLGIMQPYFFPYLGYFSLIKHTDKFILLDTVQFIRHGWIERNRILKPNTDWQYINSPLEKYSQSTLIKDIIINNNQSWKDKILAQLQHYKKRSPHYKSVMELLDNIFSEEFHDVVSLNESILKKTSNYIGFSPNIEVFSKMNLDIEPVNAPDEWALNICKVIENTSEYWNPIGGSTFFDKEKYDNSDITLRFHEVKLEEYNQKREVFEPGLSIIDVMMFNSPEVINGMLNKYELI